jgi:hypothetical protein
MKLAYFVHDTGDAAVSRRVRMLTAGGAEVTVLGFRRAEAAIDEIHGAPVIDFGRTEDARLAKRVVSVLRAAVAQKSWSAKVADVDVVLARNLEMLALAARPAARSRASLVYEALDIHRVLLGSGLSSRALRLFERTLLTGVRHLIVSSPAFVREYFAPRQGWRGSVKLVENKVLALEGPDGAVKRAETASVRAVGPPWRIGWFGVIRCRKSLNMLCALAAQSSGRIEVVIRGRPARHEFDDFDAQVAATQGVSYLGPYTAEDLGAIYRDVHFAWAIDYFEEELNSAWLLPNRLYEGPRHGAVPIALKSVQAGLWLARRGVGLCLEDPMRELPTRLSTMTVETYARLKAGVDTIPIRLLTVDPEECVALVESLR